MALVEILTHAWKAWGIQALVLLSFTLQVTLLILSEFRRFVDSGVLKFFVWSAYMTADATAIFVLGHMSVTSRSPEDELVAFWAPFLLMHLGGQDNITAYAIEDNRLWLRHLQTLSVQTAAAGYIIYESFTDGSPSFLRWASIIMFFVGTVKYGERVWTLKYAGSSPTGKNYNMFDSKGLNYNCIDRYLETEVLTGPMDTEAYLLMAQQTLGVPMDLLNRPHSRKYNEIGIDLREDERLYKVVELQLSLMYDIFYTKAEVMHSNFYGICIRMLSVLATVAALLLFHLLIVVGDHHHYRVSYNKVNMLLSYVLLVGAVVQETTSLLREMFSIWTSALLLSWRDHFRYNLIHPIVRILTHLRRIVHAADWRRRCSWSRSMGQHNLLHMCTRSITSGRSKIARWLDVEDWWNTVAYSWSFPVSAVIEKLLMDKVLECGKDLIASSEDKTGDGIFDSVGQAELKQWGLYEQKDVDWSLEDRIIIWHIATSIYMSWWYENCKQQAEADIPLAKAVEALSNYMMFLLASRPHMLPPTANRDAYVEICYVLTTICMKKGYSSVEDLVSFLQRAAEKLDATQRMESYLQASCALGSKLIEEEKKPPQEYNKSMLELLAQVWVEALCYASKGCSAYSHAKQLSNGSELITVAALLVKHMTEFSAVDMTTSVIRLRNSLSRCK